MFLCVGMLKVSGLWGKLIIFSQNSASTQFQDLFLDFLVLGNLSFESFGSLL